MSHASSFDPIIRDGAQLLILGSMPGLRSLDAQQYYAHPRNAFWPIMAELFQFDADLAYTERLQALQHHKIALWDVLADCYRPGSLDSAIVESSIHANDFAALYRQYPTLRAVFFNGGKAEQSFRKHVLPGLTGAAVIAPSGGRLAVDTVATKAATDAIQYRRLPSTSPAHASLNYLQKLAQWRQLRDFIGA